MAAKETRGHTTVAISRSMLAIGDQDLRTRVQKVVEHTRQALASARSLNFVGYEQRELQEHSLELWNEVAPRLGKVFKDLHALVETITVIFPKAESTSKDADFDVAFDLLSEGEEHPITGETVMQTPLEKVTELVHSYAWVIKQATQEETRKLREPALMQQQWNLLGELEVFRDKMMAAMHALVVAVLNVNDDVEIEAIFPAAFEATEMAVAVRQHVADLAARAEQTLATLTSKRSQDELRAILLDMDERTAQMLKLPSIGSLRAADRHELSSFRRRSAQLRATGVSQGAVKMLLDGHSKFLASLQTVELRERLAAHDKDVAQEALAALAGALKAGSSASLQRTYQAHVSRRLVRLYGVSPELDAGARALAQHALGGGTQEQLLTILQELERALKPLAA